MRSGRRHILSLAAAAFTLLLVLVSCRKDEDFRTGHDSEYNENPAPSRQADPISRKVLVVYSAGYNSLSEYLREDIEDLCEGDYIPNFRANAPVLLVFSRHNAQKTPVLFRIYRDVYDQVRRDTLHVPGLTESTPASSGETMSRVLGFVRDRYPGSQYGMVFSSHASGWLPPDYFSNPELFDGGESIWSVQKRSVGQDKQGNDSSIEMSLTEFRDALPMHLDYLLFDACLMGTVEVAYELREKADTIGFSQTEILAEGFDYKKMARSLLSEEGGGAVEVCRDYFEFYNNRPDAANRCATISVIDCHRLDALAETCAYLFKKYRLPIDGLSGATVQPYFRFNKHWFYDLEDILVKAGISNNEKAQLESALDEAIVYKAATQNFLSIRIYTYCGLSMFLPGNGSAYLKNYYKDQLAWNAATGLVY